MKETRRKLGLALTLVVVAAARGATPSYVLGPGDQISVNLRDLKEIEIKPAHVGLDGTIQLPYAGRIRAAGLSTDQLAREIEQKLMAIVRDPRVTVEVTEYGSQPVSVLGSVNKPGVHQLRGRKSLVEVLSLAEGMKPESGNVIKITRPRSSGPIPLAGSKEDATGQYFIAEVGAKALLDASVPEANIQIQPYDVISIPRAELVYIMGSVKKPGGFPLAERESVTVLQAISLAEGIQPTAAPQAARILRTSSPGAAATEVLIDVKKILAHKAPDQPLQPNDILFIPNSTAKTVGMRTLEAGIQMATGVVIWRR